MARYKKRIYVKKPFESTGASNDTSANIYMSMLMSAAWRELTPKQQQLYLYCKAQYYGEKSSNLPVEHKDNPLAFTMNQSKWRDLYGLYTYASKRYFYRDMAVLISVGLIRCIEIGSTTRTKSIYEFSDKWQKYGTPKFEVNLSEMSGHGRKYKSKITEK